jgi:hypothetical protein
MPTTLESRAEDRTESNPQPLRVPLLLERLDALADGRRQHWLDLGRAQPALIERLGCGPNRLTVADLDAPDPERGLTAPLPGTMRGGVDLVLCWDWPNYLSPEALARFGEALARVVHPGSALHALIHYRSDRMPESPQAFRLTVDGRLEGGTTVIGQRSAPRYSPKALEKSMSGWQVERTLLLNNGMQEFVLTPRAGATA